MILVQVLYFVASAFAMAAVGVGLILPPMKKGSQEQVLTRMILSFALKLLLGAGLTLVALKVLGWGTMTSAFGMVSAYIAALVMITVAAVRLSKRMGR